MLAFNLLILALTVEGVVPVRVRGRGVVSWPVTQFESLLESRTDRPAEFNQTQGCEGIAFSS